MTKMRRRAYEIALGRRAHGNTADMLLLLDRSRHRLGEESKGLYTKDRLWT